MDDVDIHKTEFISATRTVRALFNALPATQKMRAFDRMIGVLNQQATTASTYRVLTESLLEDILFEYESMQLGGTWSARTSAKTAQCSQTTATNLFLYPTGRRI